MGLDSVELVLSFEETFQISISDQAAEKMHTPRDAIDYIVFTLGTKVDGPAVIVPQRHAALWKQIVCALQEFGIADSTLTLNQSLNQVFVDRSTRRRHWKRLRKQVHANEWPHLRWLGLSTDFPAHLQTFRDLVDWLFCHRRETLTAEEIEGLTREDIGLLVKNIVLYQIGLPEEKYGEDRRFIEDMGVD